MQVTSVRTTVVGTPWRDLVFVELETDDGLVGVGEVRPVNKTDSFVAVVDELASRYVIGADPFDTERLAWAIERLEYGRPGELGQSALAAFDIASWDLIGQALGVPVWKLLGGRFRDRVPAYANGWYQADLEPARIAELATTVVARGYRAMKLDPFGAASGRLGTAERRAALAVVAAVRDAIGPDIDLMIEMHGRFSPDTAAQVAAELAPFAPRWIEEPIPPEHAGPLARVRAATNLTIATGERIHSVWDAAPFIEGGNVDVVQADLTHFGGFTGLRRLAGWTEAHYLTLAPHNVGGPVAHGRQRPFRDGDAQRGRPGALQRLRRSVGERARGRRADRRPGRWLLRPVRPSRSRPATRPRRLRPASADGGAPAAVRTGLAAARLGRLMRIVVTGAGGNVGRHVVAELASRGHEVAAVDRVDRPADLAATVRSWTVGDVGDPALMAGVMASARPDALVHLAAIPRPSLGTPLEVFATNTQATFVALETAGDAGVGRVAIASSTSALGMVFARRPVSPLYVPVDEAHPFVGSDPYALSKQVDEATAATMQRRHGYQVVALRISNTSPMPDQIERAALAARDPGEFASQLWAYLDARDAARAFALAVERDLPGCHVINVMAPDTISPEPTADLLARFHPTSVIRRAAARPRGPV